MAKAFNHESRCVLNRPKMDGGWIPSPPPDGVFITGKPSLLWRKKPSDNGNGWFAGDKLVHEFATQEEIDDVLKKERRRLEDRIRKDPAALLRAIDAVYHDIAF